jgi:hypothetical protein
MFQKEILKLNELKNKVLEWDSAIDLANSKNLRALYEAKASEDIIKQADKTAQILEDKFSSFIAVLDSIDEPSDPSVPATFTRHPGNILRYLGDLESAFRKVNEELRDTDDDDEVKRKVATLAEIATICANSFNAISTAISKTLEILSKSSKIKDYLKLDENNLDEPINSVFESVGFSRPDSQTLRVYTQAIQKTFVKPEIEVEERKSLKDLYKEKSWKKLYKRVVGRTIKVTQNLSQQFTDKEYVNDIGNMSFNDILKIKNATEQISAITSNKIRSQFLKDVGMNQNPRANPNPNPTPNPNPPPDSDDDSSDGSGPPPRPNKIGIIFGEIVYKWARELKGIDGLPIDLTKDLGEGKNALDALNFRLKKLKEELAKYPITELKNARRVEEIIDTIEVFDPNTTAFSASSKIFRAARMNNISIFADLKTEIAASVAKRAQDATKGLFENKKKISLSLLENINTSKTQLSNFENWAKIAGIK